MTEISLGEFLLAGDWVSFPDLGFDGDFKFAFPSAKARTAFAAKYLGATVVLPDRKVTLSKKTLSKDGTTFLLALQEDSSGTKIREAIVRKLTGKKAGHSINTLRNFARVWVENPGLPLGDVQQEVNSLVADGIIEINPGYAEGYYWMASPAEREKSWLEDSGTEAQRRSSR